MIPSRSSGSSCSRPGRRSASTSRSSRRRPTRSTSSSIKNKFDAWISTYYAIYPTAIDLISQYWESDGAANYTHYKNAQVDTLTAQARRTVDPAKRDALLAKVETLVGNDAAGRVPRERQLADGPQPGSPEELQLLGCLRHVLRPSLGLQLDARAARAEWPRRTFVVGVVLLGSMIALALAAPLFGNPYAIPLDGLSRDRAAARACCSPGHLLGTDQLGRDMLARTAYGARASLEIAFIANITSVGIGTIVGLVAGFYRGWVEHVLMRITDIFLSIPTVISGLALAATLGTGITGIVVVVTALYWAWTARIVFGETLALRKRTFVEAAIAQGAPGHMVIRRHILPNLTSLILTLAALNGAAVVAIGSGLAYLGAGIQPPTTRVGQHARRRAGQPRLRAAPAARPARLRRRHGLLVRAHRRGAVTARRGLAEAVVARYLTIRLALGAISIAGVDPADVRAAVLGAGRPRPPDRRPARVARGARERARRTCTSTTRGRSSCCTTSRTSRRATSATRTSRTARSAT